MKMTAILLRLYRQYGSKVSSVTSDGLEGRLFLLLRPSVTTQRFDAITLFY